MKNNQKLIKQTIFYYVVHEAHLATVIKDYLENIHLAETINPLLQEQINKFIKQILCQIPMGEYLLAGAVGKKIKLKIEEEIPFLVPEIQQYLIENAIVQKKLEEFLEKRIAGMDFSLVIAEINSAAQLKMLAFSSMAACAGALLGLCEVLFLCR